MFFGSVSGYTALPSVAAKEEKSMTPFNGSRNRHGSSAIMNDDKTAQIILKIVSQVIVLRRIPSKRN
jgi:hypothetical protein